MGNRQRIGGSRIFWVGCHGNQKIETIRMTEMALASGASMVPSGKRCARRPGRACLNLFQADSGV